eukprot:5903344-Pyramimonas_sp.AAC.1
MPGSLHASRQGLEASVWSRIPCTVLGPSCTCPRGQTAGWQCVGAATEAPCAICRGASLITA